MTYPYYQLVTGKPSEIPASLPKDLKKTPVLYLYGTSKNFLMHDRGALAFLEREAREGRSKSNAIAVDNAGHYLFLQKPDKCLEEVMKFMAMDGTCSV